MRIKICMAARTCYFRAKVQLDPLPLQGDLWIRLLRATDWTLVGLVIGSAQQLSALELCPAVQSSFITGDIRSDGSSSAFSVSRCYSLATWKCSDMFIDEGRLRTRPCIIRPLADHLPDALRK